jgi:hypothetical protein
MGLLSYDNTCGLRTRAAPPAVVVAYALPKDREGSCPWPWQDRGPADASGVPSVLTSEVLEHADARASGRHPWGRWGAPRDIAVTRRALLSEALALMAPHAGRAQEGRSGDRLPEHSYCRCQRPAQPCGCARRGRTSRLPQAAGQVVVELPGLTNKAQALAVIQTTARLELRSVPQLDHGT